MRTRAEMKQMQSLPLDVKVLKTKARLREWIDHYGLENVFISFSGGKDSSVLLDIARQEYPKIEAVFVDTGLEYPEIREFVKGFDNVTWLHPKLYEYCMNGGEHNEKGIWIPNKKGLGMRYVIDELNKIYGKDFILY